MLTPFLGVTSGNCSRPAHVFAFMACLTSKGGILFFRPYLLRAYFFFCPDVAIVHLQHSSHSVLQNGPAVLSAADLCPGACDSQFLVTIPFPSPPYVSSCPILNKTSPSLLALSVKWDYFSGWGSFPSSDPTLKFYSAPSPARRISSLSASFLSMPSTTESAPSLGKVRPKFPPTPPTFFSSSPHGDHTGVSRRVCPPLLGTLPFFNLGERLHIAYWLLSAFFAFLATPTSRRALN